MPAVDIVTAPMVLSAPIDQELLFKSMSATEELGRMFEFDIEALSPSTDITPEDLLGKPVSVALELDGEQTRYFHGLVCAMGISGTDSRMFGYRLILRPWLWLMTRRTDTRIFQRLDVVDILRQVFEPFGPDCRFDLKGTFPKYDYCVQYRETDFNFASRLMEQEGIYYYFTHTADKHTMVLVDTPSAHKPNAWQETFQFRDSIDGQLEFEAVTQWQTTREIQSGKVVLRDYNFETPSTSLEVQAATARPKASTLLEHYDYPGYYGKKPDGDRYSKLRIQELQSRYSRIHGAGALRGMACGSRFTLAGHPRADQNREHLVLSTRMQMAYRGYESGPDRTYCQCQFIAMDGDEVYRPERITPKPLVAGVHTAVVVGPAGDEIYTDEHGRVKVQFHWDRQGKKDAKSSCWVRVSSPWAGQKWGMIALPRIGQEVIVDFLEGDPDRPIVTGRVYNALQTPPYSLPDQATVSTARSRSSKGGSASNANELRFEDKKGQEYVWLQAEKDFHQLVKNNATRYVASNQDSIIGNDLTEKIGGYEKRKIKKDCVAEVEGSHSLKVKQDMITDSLTISQKAGTSLDVKAGTQAAVEAGTQMHVKAGVTLVIEAGVMLTLKAAGSSVVIGPAGVTIDGPLVMINCGGSPGSGSGAKPKAALAAKDAEQKKDPLNS